jgi:hypothetical protein
VADCRSRAISSLVLLAQTDNVTLGAGVAARRVHWLSHTSRVAGAPLYLDPDVAAVRALWAQSGAETTNVVLEQLAAFAEAV